MIIRAVYRLFMTDVSGWVKILNGMGRAKILYLRGHARPMRT